MQITIINLTLCLQLITNPFTFIIEGSLVSNEIKEIFDLFDKNNRGTVATSELGTLVRALNLNPTETEITEMQNKVDPKQTGQFTLEVLEKTVQERGKDKETLQDLIDALKVFDSDHDGKITVRDFKHAMMTMGERMGEREIDEIVNDSELVSNDHINIDEFAKMIMNRI